MWGGWLLILSMVGLIAWAIWMATRRQDPPSHGFSQARSILDERYAAGEIDRDEYLQRRTDIDR